MKIAVVTKKDSVYASIRRDILDALSRDGSFDVQECDTADDIASDAERILVFGGDGTVLTTVQKSAEFSIPILGVNLGNLGFLAECEQNADVPAILDALKSERFVKRMLLQAEIGGEKLFALNDVVVKSVTTRPVHADLYLDGEYVDTYHSDGVIVSSPTGSTAYSLSAGGPVLAPNVHAIVINPVCAHSLHSRPLVVSYRSVISLKVTQTDEKAAVVVDGNRTFDIADSGELRITKADNYARFIAVDKNNFYNKLLEKMNRWGTTRH